MIEFIRSFLDFEIVTSKCKHIINWYFINPECTQGVLFTFAHVGPSQEAQNDAAMVVSNRTSSLSVIQRMALQGNTLRNESRLNTEKSLAPKRPFSEVLTPEDVSRRLWQEFGYAPQRSFPKFQVSNEESTQSLNSTQPKRLITKFRVWMFFLFDVM